ncbi:hypothetical protein I308_102856 [Cryptococcus tetragattii IND107]|uniref:Uncharacterized protein n=1 Tax=Cryptococcus tetragattii IND107 TaxID=1296105 RepID=A0ABR3BVH4_9TREE
MEAVSRSKPKSEISVLHLFFAVNRSDTSTEQPTTNSGLETSLPLARPRSPVLSLFSPPVYRVTTTLFLPISLLSTLSSTHSTFTTVSSGTPWSFPRRLPRASSFHIHRHHSILIGHMLVDHIALGRSLYCFSPFLDCL